MHQTETQLPNPSFHLKNWMAREPNLHPGQRTGDAVTYLANELLRKAPAYPTVRSGYYCCRHAARP
jgi:hypothetical protein